MRIMVCASMSFADEMFEIKLRLEELGHFVVVSSFLESHRGLSVEESETRAIEEKHQDDAMRVDFKKIQEIDAILVLNYDKRGIVNYIGGNTFLEMGLAHVLGKKIYLLNDIPKVPIYHSEIVAFEPTVIYGDPLQIGREV